MGYRSTNNTEYFAKYHIIWCPKYWRRVLDVAPLGGAPLGGAPLGGAPLDVVLRYVENQKTAA